MTDYLHRLFVVIPAARRAGLNAWIKANLDPTGGDWFVASLNATGSTGAITHYAADFAVTNTQAKKLLGRLCQQAGIPEPSGWDGWTRQQKKDWLLSQRAAIRTAIGVRILASDNEGTWGDKAAELTAAGLKFRRFAS